MYQFLTYVELLYGLQYIIYKTLRSYPCHRIRCSTWFCSIIFNSGLCSEIPSSFCGYCSGITWSGPPIGTLLKEVEEVTHVVPCNWFFELCPAVGAPLPDFLPICFGLFPRTVWGREGTENGSPMHLNIASVSATRRQKACVWVKQTLTENLQARAREAHVHLKWSTHKGTHLEESQSLPLLFHSWPSAPIWFGTLFKIAHWHGFCWVTPCIKVSGFH